MGEHTPTPWEVQRLNHADALAAALIAAAKEARLKEVANG
jgi:hypothetical protein